MNQKAIFLIEDDLDLRESLKELLQMEGYDVDQASDGRDALNKLKVRGAMPNLILLDWMMPRMDGAQFCVAKKSFPHIDRVPIVLLTADGRVNEKIAQIGAALGIAKPVDVDILLAAVEKFA